MSPNKMALLDGEIILYFNNGGEVYYCRFNNQSGKTRYIRKSLKTKSYELAIIRARDHYMRHIALVKEGIDPIAIDWDKAVKVYLPRIDNLNVKSLFIKMNKTYFAPYFKRFASVRAVTSEDLTGYFKWRVRYWQNNKRDGLAYYKKVPAPETLIKDRRFINLIFNFLFNEKRIHTKPSMPTMAKIRAIVRDAGGKQSETSARRPALSIKQYMGWRHHIESKIFKIKNWAPSVQKVNNIRLLLWIRILGATGIRPQELKKIRFKDISYRINNVTSNEILVIRISGAIAKTKKFRICPSVEENDGLRALLVLWKEINNQVFGYQMSGEDLIFPKKRFRTDPVDFWQEPISMIAAVNKSLKEIELYVTEDVEGNRTTLSSYSLRSMYITESIKSGVPPHLIAKACGTSTDMISRHYDGSDAIDFVDYLLDRKPTSTSWKKPKQ
jgi:integrase